MHPKIIAADAALKEGRKTDAANLLIEALGEQPEAGRQAYHVLLHILLEQRRADDGVTWAGRSAELFPNDYAFLNLYGAFLSMAGRPKEALKIFESAIRLRPNEIAAIVNKGHSLNDMGDGPTAEPIFTKLVRQQPRNPGFLRGLAKALSLQKKFDAAERRLRQALALNAKDVDVWLDLSAVASDRADRTGALDTLARAVNALPEDPRLSHARAVMLRHAGQDREAAAFLQTISERFGQHAWLHHELGRALASSEPANATIYHRKAVELAPANRDYRLAFAEHLLRTPGSVEGQHIDDAYRVLAQCRQPDKPELIDSKVRTQILTRVADFEASSATGSFADLGRLWARSGLHTALLDQLARVESNEDRQELVNQHRIWGDKTIERARLNPIKRSSGPRSTSRIRLGIMSSDLRNHPVTYFAWPLFEHADRERFEIYCYSFYRGGDASPVQQKLATMVDEFRWTPSISDRDAAQMIADDQIDILFELGGSTYMNKVEVMAWKPAPLSASWLGYPHSAGLSTIDYLLMDPHLNPTDSSLLIERPLLMPSSWIVMSEQAFPDQHRIEPVVPVRRNGFISFGTANSTYKYNPSMLRAWARIVARVPGSRFVFVRPEAGSTIFQRNIRARFEAEGVSGDRIDFRAVRGAHMPHYNDIDIALDTFPQTGGTTTCEALWMGVPTVTLVGPALYERLSYSILMNAGLGNLCATSIEAFENIAVAFAGDADHLQSLRNGLREQVRSSPLGRSEPFARDFYDLVNRAVSGEAAARPLSPIDGSS